MAQKVLGVNIFRTSALAEHELGVIAENPSGGSGVFQFNDLLPQSGASVTGPAFVTTTRRFDPGGIYKYVQANGTIVAGDGVKQDATFGAGTPALVEQRESTVIQVTAATDNIEGVAMAAMNTTTAKFGWIQIEGKHFFANVPDAVADGAVLTGAAAGAFAANTGIAADGIAIAGGRGVKKVADATEVTGGTGLTNKGVVRIRA